VRLRFNYPKKQEDKPWTAPEEIKVPGPDEKALVHHGGERLEWQVVG